MAMYDLDNLTNPEKERQAVVGCKGFQCLAYRDSHGIWRSVADDKALEVPEVAMRFDLARKSWPSCA